MNEPLKPIYFDFVTTEQLEIIFRAYRNTYGMRNLLSQLDKTCDICGGELTAVGCSNCLLKQRDKAIDALGNILDLSQQTGRSFEAQSFDAVEIAQNTLREIKQPTNINQTK